MKRGEDQKRSVAQKCFVFGKTYDEDQKKKCFWSRIAVCGTEMSTHPKNIIISSRCFVLALSYKELKTAKGRIMADLLMIHEGLLLFVRTQDSFLLKI